MLLLLSYFVYVGRYQLTEFISSGSDERNSKEIKGSERSQVGSFISSIYCRERLNHFPYVVLSVTTHLGKMYLSIGINSTWQRMTTHQRYKISVYRLRQVITSGLKPRLWSAKKELLIRGLASGHRERKEPRVKQNRGSCISVIASVKGSKTKVMLWNRKLWYPG